MPAAEQAHAEGNRVGNGRGRVAWDSRGLWYWIPIPLLIGSFFVDQPLQLALRSVGSVMIIGTTVALRRRDPSWARINSRRRNRVVDVRRTMSLDDPVESMRSMRKAFVGSVLISVRPMADGFRVYVEADDRSLVSESIEYPTLQPAIDAALVEIAKRRQRPLLSDSGEPAALSD